MQNNDTAPTTIPSPFRARLAALLEFLVDYLKDALYLSDIIPGTDFNIPPPERSPSAKNAGLSDLALSVKEQDGDILHSLSVKFADVLVVLINLTYLLIFPRTFNESHARNSARDPGFIRQCLLRWPLSKVYIANHDLDKTHPVQRYYSLPRRFNVSDDLAARMRAEGSNWPFYTTVCHQMPDQDSKAFVPDLTRLDEIASVKSSADYVREATRRKYINETNAEERAEMARACYLRGYSRPIEVASPDDWTAFRAELRESNHRGDELGDAETPHAVNIAVSYKGKETKISRRFQDFDDDDESEPNCNVDDCVTAQGKKKKKKKKSRRITKTVDEIKQLTLDFVDDFRWGQLKLACEQIAKEHECTHVRLWIDRLMKYNLDEERREEIENLVKWEDIGLFAYAVCPVARLYDRTEKDFGTDFWRRIELVLGVAGRGVYVEDFMVRQYDETIFYGKELYTRLDCGFARLGGSGVYLRGVTLAMATAVLTDGVSLSERNESHESLKAVGGWKAWALRTITEGAYSANHDIMMSDEHEQPMVVTLASFRTAVFWESFLCQSRDLFGPGYLDMASQFESQSWTVDRWDGVTAWLGMISAASKILPEERVKIMEFLTRHCSSLTLTSTTGHSGCLLTLTDSIGEGIQRKFLKRTLGVELTRFSSSSEGRVVGVAEATGLNGRRILPWYLVHVPDPVNDQIIERESNGYTYIVYKSMMIVSVFALALAKLSMILSPILMIVLFIAFNNTGLRLLIIAAFLIIVVMFWAQGWPWSDARDEGEGLFDNMHMHGLHESEIKWKNFRELKSCSYDLIRWE